MLALSLLAEIGVSLLGLIALVALVWLIRARTSGKYHIELELRVQTKNGHDKKGEDDEPPG